MAYKVKKVTKKKENEKEKNKIVKVVESTAKLLNENDARYDTAYLKAASPQPIFIPNYNSTDITPVVAATSLEYTLGVDDVYNKDCSLATKLAMMSPVGADARFKHSVYEYIYNNSRITAAMKDIPDMAKSGSSPFPESARIRNCIGNAISQQFNNRVLSLVRSVLLNFFNHIEGTLLRVGKCILEDKDFYMIEDYLEGSFNEYVLVNILRAELSPLYYDNERTGKSFDGLLHDISWEFKLMSDDPELSDPDIFALSPDPYYIIFQNVQIPTIITDVANFLEDITVRIASRPYFRNQLVIYDLIMDSLAADIVELKAPLCSIYLQLRSEGFLYYHSAEPSDVADKIIDVKYGDDNKDVISEYIKAYLELKDEMVKEMNGFDADVALSKLME